MADVVLVTGDDVRDLRTELELSQSEIAEALGTSKKTVYNWESRGASALPERAGRRFLASARRVVGERGLATVISADNRRLLGIETATAPEPDEGAVSEMTDYLNASVDRLADVYRGSEADLARRLLRLTQLADSALDLAELATELGVEPRVVKRLTEGVVSVVIDSGAFSVFSSMEAYADIPMSLLARSGDVYRRARESNEKRPFASVDLDGEALDSTGESDED